MNDYNSIVQDGNFWNKMRHIFKTLYVLAFINGYMKAICSCAATITKNEEEYNRFINLFNLVTEKYIHNKIIQVTDDIYSVDKYKTIKLDKLIEFVVIPSIKENWNKEKLYNEALSLLLVQERTTK